MRMHWRMLSSMIVCVMLVTGLLSPLRADRAAISATVAPDATLPEGKPLAGPPLRLAAGTFDPLREAGPGSATAALQLTAYPGDGAGYYLVQFQGPVAAADALKAAGVEVFDYIPDFAFIVKMDNAGRAAVERMAQVRWVGLYQPAYRLAPDLLARAEAIESANAPVADESLALVVSIFRGETVTPVAASVRGLRGVILDQSQTTWQSKLKVTLPTSALAQLAAIPGVRWIELAPQWKLHNDRADNVMGVREVWDTQGLYGAGQTVAVCDTGLDKGSTLPADLHDDFENGSGVSRVIGLYDLVGGGDGAEDRNSGHGTHVAGSVLGNGDLSGATPSTHTYPETAHVGMAPEASLLFQAVESDAGELSGIPLDLNDLFPQAYTGGARLHTNSWGADESGKYTTDSEAVDQYMWDHKDFTIFFSAGNAGTDANADGIVDLDSLGSPATAKNCVTVGASENNRPELTYTWGSGWPSDFPTNPVRDDKMADNIAGLAAFSSRGPVDDYRYKPDVVAPGSFIASVRSSMATGTGWGVIDTNYMYMGGTSMSTPLVAGAAAIVRQFYTDVKGYNTPSAALIKATLINGATDIYPGQYGTGTTQEIPATRPTNVAGWGRVNVQNSIFPTAPRAMVYVDQTTGLGTAASDVYNYQITSSAAPFRVTVVWTDYPGSPMSDGALVNDLDLTITGPSGTLYYPNKALNSDGSPSATHDRVNNVQGIDIASPATGMYTVTVNGFHVPHGPQPYALVASGIFNVANTAPTLASLPDLTLGLGESRDNAIDLWQYTYDVLDNDADLTFSITNAPPADAGVSLDSNQYIDINPTSGFTGTVPVEVQVMDTGGLTDTDTFIITFRDVENFRVYLPVVIRRYPPLPYTPTLNAIDNSDGDGNYAVSWSAANLASTYELQEATNVAFTGATTVYSGTLTSWNVSGKPNGTYYYRVRGYNAYGYGSWSNVQSATVAPPTRFNATADACILQGYPGNNAGSTTDMWAGYDDYLSPAGQIVRSLLKFDISAISAGTYINSAVLRVYYVGYYDYANRSRTVTSYRIGSNWSEGSVTWNTAPSVGEAYGSVALIAADGSFGWYSIDVTNLVRGWVNGTLPNYGVMLRGPEQSGSDSSWRSFATKEAGSGYIPYLQITYSGMAATDVELDTVVPRVGYVLPNGPRSFKQLQGVQKNSLCELLGCITP